MPKAFSEYEKKVIRQRLLEQGYRLFAAHGLRKTNIEELAAAAGISKGAFYLFYDSKETLFLDVMEMAEEQFRQKVLADVARPGPTPHARMLALLKDIFPLWKTVPVLKYFSRVDFDQLMRRFPEEKLREHLASDRKFIPELIDRCRQAGIPIQVSAEQFINLTYTLVIVSLHEDDLIPLYSAGALDLLLEVCVSYFLGEISMPNEDRTARDSSPEKDGQSGPHH